jgi:hypothetical protein
MVILLIILFRLPFLEAGLMTAESQMESHAKVCRAQVILFTFNKPSPILPPSFKNG